MRVVTIGIVDYGMGNHASVAHGLRDLGYRVRVSKQASDLDSANVIVLPGVGAFPAAMRSLHSQGLVTYLQESARQLRPVVGICLGMELLASASHELEYTSGLDMIPGEFVPFADRGWHIGWNTLECVGSDPSFQSSDGQAFYFNHSFRYEGPAEYQVAVSRHQAPFASVIRRGCVVGLQFHPEKSQVAGQELLKSLIEDLVGA